MGVLALEEGHLLVLVPPAEPEVPLLAGQRRFALVAGFALRDPHRGWDDGAVVAGRCEGSRSGLTRGGGTRGLSGRRRTKGWRGCCDRKVSAPRATVILDLTRCPQCLCYLESFLSSPGGWQPGPGVGASKRKETVCQG